ncbi:MAG: hypothetical protein QOI20_2050 [Acidimicrobiaceae bacterium]|nr:hypothetical protein [Acidimicrobiaceae bacterium]
MSLHGTLETFALPDVMALLAATKKTGELRVVGGRLDGRVHLDDGRVVAASVGRADSFVDAVFELLRLTSGKFSFDAEKRPDEPTDPVDIEPLLLEAQARLTEWRAIEAVVPSMDHGVMLVDDLSDPHVTLAADQWRMVVAVAGATCVSEVADRLGLGEYGACKALKELVESGVAEITAPPAPAPKKAEPKPAAKAEAPKREPEPEPVAEAEPEAESDEDQAPEPEPEPEPEPVRAAAKPVIEPELKRKALPDEPVRVAALTTTDRLSPIPPGQEPPAPKPKARPKEDAHVDAAQAKQLVSQLASMGAEKADKPKAGPPKAEPAKAEPPKAEPPKAEPVKAESAKADAGGPTPKDKAADADTEGKADAAAGSTPEGDGEEPLNRGLLLKFLSSVRQ